MRFCVLGGLAVAVSMILTSCGPIYRTQYQFGPLPRGAEGCANNCLMARQMCYQGCSMQEQNCRQMAQQETYLRDIGNLAVQQAQIQNGMRPRNNASGPAFNNPNFGRCTTQKDDCEAQCDATYRMCYTNCGGTVVAHQVCTMFCN